MTRTWTTFGELRAMAQRARSLTRDLALCETLRDTPRSWLREQGMLSYIVSTLFEGDERVARLEHPGDLVRALRRGELFGEARDALVDLRGYKHPSEQVLEELLAYSQRSPIAHLILDHTMCGADWLVRLLAQGDWSGLRWLSVRGCQLVGSLKQVIDALPEGVVGLMCGGNRLTGEDLKALFEGRRLAPLRWLDVSGCGASEADFDGCITRARGLDVALLGLDVSGVAGFADGQLIRAMDAGMLRHVISWRGQESGVSEYGLPALLWALPAGQLDELSFGDSRDERELYVDDRAILELLDIPAYDALSCFEWAHAQSALYSLHAHRRTDETALKALAQKSWSQGLERCGLHGFSLAAIGQSGVFEPMTGLRELALTDLRLSEVMHTPDQPPHQDELSRLAALWRQAFKPMNLTTLELGFFDDEHSRNRRIRSGDDWNEERLTNVIKELADALDPRAYARFVWHGERGMRRWFEEMSARSCLMEHVVLLASHPDFGLDERVLAKSCRLARCACVETNVHIMTSVLLEILREGLTHPRMKRALQGSRARFLLT